MTDASLDEHDLLSQARWWCSWATEPVPGHHHSRARSSGEIPPYPLVIASQEGVVKHHPQFWTALDQKAQAVAELCPDPSVADPARHGGSPDRLQDREPHGRADAAARSARRPRRRAPSLPSPRRRREDGSEPRDQRARSRRHNASLAGRADPPSPGFVVRTQRGVPGVVQEISNFTQFTNYFGGYVAYSNDQRNPDEGFVSACPHASARGFFDNGGATAYVLRIIDCHDGEGRHADVQRRRAGGGRHGGRRHGGRRHDGRRHDGRRHDGRRHSRAAARRAAARRGGGTAGGGTANAAARRGRTSGGSIDCVARRWRSRPPIAAFPIPAPGVRRSA